MDIKPDKNRKSRETRKDEQRKRLGGYAARLMKKRGGNA